MAEWLKAHDSKSCGQQCLGGSNPLASATELKMTHFKDDPFWVIFYGNFRGIYGVYF